MAVSPPTAGKVSPIFGVSVSSSLSLSRLPTSKKLPDVGGSGAFRRLLSAMGISIRSSSKSSVGMAAPFISTSRMAEKRMVPMSFSASNLISVLVGEILTSMEAGSQERKRKYSGFSPFGIISP